VIALQVTGTRPTPTEAQFELEFLFGARLTAWNAFAISYLVLGLRAFSRCDRAELVRRVLAKPLPTSRAKRWLLAGGGGPGWPVVIALVAFVTIVTAVLSRDDATDLILALAAGTVVTCWMVITFSFALQYARRDIEQGGLKFPGSEEPVRCCAEARGVRRRECPSNADRSCNRRQRRRGLEGLLNASDFATESSALVVCKIQHVVQGDPALQG
jgi:hypothetical protein